jgi:hypothetical protein
MQVAPRVMTGAILLSSLTAPLSGAVTMSGIGGYARPVSTAPCRPSTRTVNGNIVTAYCGPARVTIDLGGRRLVIAHGSCQHGKTKSGPDYYSVVIGTAADLPAPEYNYFQLDVLPAPGAGTYTGKSVSIQFAIGTSDYLLDAVGGHARAVLSAGLRGGTFTGKLTEATSGRAASGSWSC